MAPKLSEGMPGSLHPICDAKPSAPQTDSVAAENPHAARKLSSGVAKRSEPMSSKGPDIHAPRSMDDAVSARVEDIMTPSVVTVSTHLPLKDAMAAMVREQVSGMPVVNDNGELVGVLTLGDATSALGDISDAIASARQGSSGEHEAVFISAMSSVLVSEDLAEADVGSVMTPQVIAVTPTATVRSAAALMVDERIHRVFVVDGAQLLGVVSSMDVLSVVARG